MSYRVVMRTDITLFYCLKTIEINLLIEFRCLICSFELILKNNTCAFVKLMKVLLSCFFKYKQSSK